MATTTPNHLIGMCGQLSTQVLLRSFQKCGNSGTPTENPGIASYYLLSLDAYTSCCAFTYSVVAELHMHYCLTAWNVFASMNALDRFS